MTPRLVLVAAIAVALSTSDANAQTVPLLSGDLTAGAGSTTEHVGNTWFRTSSSSMTSADLAVRIGGAGQLRPVVVAGYSFNAFGADQTSDCPLAPGGGCKVYFPRTFGPSIGVGLRDAISERFLLGVTAGIASFTNQARFAEVAASWRLITHLAVVGKFRYFDMPYVGQHVWFAPITVGARLTW